MGNNQPAPNRSSNSTNGKNKADNQKNKSQKQSERQSSKLSQCNSDIEKQDELIQSDDDVQKQQQSQKKKGKSKKNKSKKSVQSHNYQQEIIDLDKEDIQRKYFERIGSYNTANNESNQDKGNNKKFDKQDRSRQRQNKHKIEKNMYQTQRVQDLLPPSQKQKLKQQSNQRQSGSPRAQQGKCGQIITFIKIFLQIWITFAYQTLLTVFRLTKQLLWYLYRKAKGLWITGELTLLLFLASFIFLMLPIGLPVLQFLVRNYVSLRYIQSPTLQMYDDEAIF